MIIADMRPINEDGNPGSSQNRLFVHVGVELGVGWWREVEVESEINPGDLRFYKISQQMCQVGNEYIIYELRVRFRARHVFEDDHHTVQCFLNL